MHKQHNNITSGIGLAPFHFVWYFLNEQKSDNMNTINGDRIIFRYCIHCTKPSANLNVILSIIFS